jgi:hypothetical protein
MVEESMILDGNERMLEVDGNLGERHVLTVFIHPEPPPAVRGKEPCVAHAPPQLVHGPGLPQRPGQADRRRDDEHAEYGGGYPIPHPRRNPDPANHERARRASRVNDSTA